MLFKDSFVVLPINVADKKNLHCLFSNKEHCRQDFVS